MKPAHNSIKKICFLLIILTTAAFVGFPISSVKSQNLKIIRENRRFYVLYPNGKKVEIVKEHEGGADNVVVLSPDAKYVFYTDATGIGFESSGKDLFYCKPDGTGRTFLHKLGGDVEHVNWIKKNGHTYLLFLEVLGGAGVATIDLFDFDQRKMLLKMKGWGLERIEESDCFILKDELGNLKKGTNICLDSLLSISDPDKYNIEVYAGYGEPNLLFLSTRREAFLNPESSWPDAPNESLVRAFYGELGQCCPSPFGTKNAFCINMDTKSWIGVLNNKRNKFQFLDSINVGEYKYNFVWSNNDRFLGFVESYPDSYQEIVILEFLGDSSYAIKEDIKLKEEREIELIGWSILKNGFYYIIGKKEFLKVQE
jgi:hypothetical protein